MIFKSLKLKPQLRPGFSSYARIFPIMANKKIRSLDIHTIFVVFRLQKENICSNTITCSVLVESFDKYLFIPNTFTCILTDITDSDLRTDTYCESWPCSFHQTRPKFERFKFKRISSRSRSSKPDYTRFLPRLAYNSAQLV